MNHIFLKILLIILLFVIFISTSAYSYSSAVSNNIADSIFRLHVIANSNSSDDQTLKLEIRDNVLKYMNSILVNTNSKSEAINIVKSHINEIYSIAKTTCKTYGYDYPINISVGKSDFPTKVYGDVTLPAGIYDSLKIEIGSSSGNNWWCVMFPPLCFVDVSSGIVPAESKEILKNKLDTEEFNLITSTDSSRELSFKFKIVEFIENLKISIAKN